MAQETCWPLIRAAASGRAPEREAFARLYIGSVRRCLAARWRGSPLVRELDDAVQEVFVTCFERGGALDRVDPALGKAFRLFLFGVVRNVAREFERRSRRNPLRSNRLLDESPDDAPALSRSHDRDHARAIMRETANRMAQRARAAGPAASRRVDILRMRFEDGLPVRAIAKAWHADPADVHREYAKARREFRAVLREVVGLAERCGNDRMELECDRLLELLR